MNKSSMKATNLRNLMIIIVVILVAASAGGFYYTLNWFSQISSDIRPSNSTNISSKDLTTLQQNIISAQNVVDKANLLLFSNSDYKNQITKDLNKYASNYNVSISSISVTGSQSPISVTLTIKNPVTFTNLMRFIKATEISIPKMQVTNINLSHAQNANDKITVDNLNLEAYID